MTTHDLAEVIATDSGLTKVQADRALNSLASNVTNALKNNEEVYIAGIGTFTTARIPTNKAAASAAQNTSNLETTRVPRFEPGSELLTAIR